MKRLFVLCFILGGLMLSGCSNASNAEERVETLIRALYFGEGTYEEYKNTFQHEDRTISQQEFEAIQKQGPSSLFPSAEQFEDVRKQLQTYTVNDKAAVVFWADFSLDKSRDLRWDVVKTDDGWKIKN